MGIEKGLWCWCLVSWLSLLLMEGAVSSGEQSKPCAPSRCGIITNISYPFRLPHDPPNCGHPEYELACENNVTILHLLDYYDLNNGTYRAVGRYRVLGIDYNKYRIRLVDEGIEEGNCSSLPLYSLSLSNIDFLGDGVYLGSDIPYSAGPRNKDMTETRLTKQVGYLECSEAVRDDAAYVDTAPCVNWESKGGGHLYAVAGDLMADQFKPQCLLKSVTLIASDWEPVVAGGGIKSYDDIHAQLSSGFELSWLNRACFDRNCPEYTYCAFITEVQGPQCVAYYQDCATPLGKDAQCRKHLTIPISIIIMIIRY